MTRLQVGAVLLFASVAGALLTIWVLQSSDVPFLRSDEPGHWIGADLRITTNAVGVDQTRLPVTQFRRRFTPPAERAPLRLQVTALRHFSLFLNDELIGATSGNWKHPSVFEVPPDWSLAARAELRVEVRNDAGPGLLRLAAESGDFRLLSDSDWTVSVDNSSSQPARIADDQRRGSAGLATPTIWQHARAKWSLLVATFTTVMLLSTFGRDRLARLSASRATRLTSAVIGVFWLSVLLAKASQLPIYVGFDGPDHLDYLRFVAERWQLPLATNGPAMYQPPLFYLLSAILAAGFGIDGDASQIGLRLLPLASGLCHVAVAYRLARLLYPSEKGLALVAIAAAGLFPMNIYMGVYFSNEPFNAALASLALLLTVEIVLSRGVTGRLRLGLGLILGLALLTKATSLLLLPLCLVFLFAADQLVDRESFRRSLTRSAPMLAVTAVVSGWYFARNQLALGQPVVGNWDVPGAIVTWWQHPGFHTASYYLSFGDVLQRPYFAGFHSFWDGLYSTFWGDGLIAGVASVVHRHSLWNYGYMSLIYPIALPATAAMAAGLVAMAAESLHGDDRRRRLALVFLLACVLVYFGAVWVMTLRLPFYAQARAPYALSLMAPLAVATALCLTRLERALSGSRVRLVQAALHGWAATLIAVIVLGFIG